MVFLASNNNLDLQSIFSYELSAISWDLATAYGSPLKTNNASYFHILKKEHIIIKYPAVVVDFRGLIQSLPRLSSTYKELIIQILKCLPTKKSIDLMCDQYLNSFLNL